MIRPLLLALALSACGKDKDHDTQSTDLDLLTFDIAAPGPFNTGFRSWPVTTEVLGESRTIVVNVWYPTNAKAGGEVRYAGLQEDPLAFGDVDPAPPVREKYPLLAYSHGHQGFGGTSSEMMRFFASHGWVAVAPDHRGNLLTDNPDNEEPWFDALRPMDVITSVDALVGLPDTDALSAVDTDQYVVVGHSRGCTTVWSLIGATYNASNPDDYCPGCDASHLAAFTDGSVVDPRAIAAIPMAGTYSQDTYGATGFQSVTAPILSMTGTADNPERSQAQWGAIDGLDFSWLDLEGGCHQTFALGTCETLDVPEGFAMIDTYALAFARKHLLGDAGQQTTGLLDGSIELDARARFLVK